MEGNPEVDKRVHEALKSDDDFPFPDRKGPLGLTALYDPRGAVVDIVFVHGLNGGRIKTWTKDGVCWPFDLLPKDIPDSRILTWGYDSQIYSFFRSTTQTTLSDISRDLLQHLLLLRESSNSSDRPIIFVCHSIGGLVVKKALSESTSDVEGTRCISHRTIGVLFFGTPHLGATTRFPGLLDRMKLIAAGLPTNDFPQLLQSRQDADLLKDFNFPTISFSEDRSTDTGGMVREDATLVVGAVSHSLQATHAEIAKFGSRDGGYKLALDALKRLLHNHHLVTTSPPGQPPGRERKTHGAAARKKPAAKLRELATLLGRVELQPEPEAPKPYQRLIQELKYFREVTTALSKHRVPGNGATNPAVSQCMRVLGGFTGELEQIVEELKACVLTEDGKRDIQGKESLIQQMAADLGRNLSTVNTLLLLSPGLNQGLAWRPLFQSGSQRAAPAFHFDALSFNAATGGPRVVSHGDVRPTPLSTSSAWFGHFEQCHKLLAPLQGDSHEISNSALDKSPPKVKIAVLDTGLHPALMPKVKAYLDFMDESPPLDLDGHGTFVTDLLLKIAPNAEVYVGRVLSDAAEEPHLYDSEDIVSRAIRHAMGTWDVSIISMSFGFSAAKPESVNAAIRLCSEAQILLFAAASNTGTLGTPTRSYPASHTGGVFCINSCNGLGAPSEFTPPPHKNSDNFITVGEDVVAAFPRSLLRDHHRHDPSDAVSEVGSLDRDEESSQSDSDEDGLVYVELNGTSMATPIAAGIAALLIEFSRQHEELFADDPVGLETFGGMHAVLRFISHGEKRDGYDFIKPWELLRPEWKPEMIAHLIKYALSKREK